VNFVIKILSNILLVEYVPKKHYDVIAS